MACLYVVMCALSQIDLQPIEGEILARFSSSTQDGAKLDIAANGFRGGWFESTFVAVRGFNPHVLSNRYLWSTGSMSLRRSMREIKHVSFIFLLFS